jgi:hypothetical protein
LGADIWDFWIMFELRLNTLLCGICVSLCLALSACGGGGGGAPQTAVATSQGTQPLTISGNPATSITEGLAYSFTPSVSGGGGNSPTTFRISNNLPSWASFNGSTGTLSGTPGIGDVGMVYSGITISADDGQQSASLAAFDITVLGSSSGSATLSWTAPTENEDMTPLTDLARFTVYYGMAVDDYSNSKSIGNPTVTISVVENLSAGTWYFVVSAFDASGNESQKSNSVSVTII